MYMQSSCSCAHVKLRIKFVLEPQPEVLPGSALGNSCRQAGKPYGMPRIEPRSGSLKAKALLAVFHSSEGSKNFRLLL